MDKKNIVKFKKILLEEKEKVLNNSRKNLDDIKIDTDDLMDETDLAATEMSQNVAFTLRDRERVLLAKIDQALARLEEGNFGTCETCEEPIEVKRLEARPVTTLCLSCKEQQEHKEKVYA